MIRMIFLLFVIALQLQAIAQYTVKGRITDAQTGYVLQNAGILLENTYYSTGTNENGEFALHKVKKGKYILKVIYIGYKTYQEELNVDADKVISVSLAHEVLMTDEVIITSTRAGDKVPAAIMNINRKDIRKVNLGADFPYIINNVPSAVITSDAGAGVGYTGIRIRGSDLTRINVTMNGIPVNDPESQMVYFVDLPDFASSVDNVQIQRGVGTSSNGAASFGASINIQTLKLNADPYFEVNNSYGSFNTWKNNLVFGTGLINGKWTLDGRLSRISSDGYIDRAFSDLKSYFLSAGYYGKRTMLRFNILSGSEKTYQAWYGVPEDSLKTNRTFNPYTYPGQTDNYRQDYYQLIYSVDLLKNLSVNAALFLTRGKGYYEEYRENESFTEYGLTAPVFMKDTVIRIDTVISGNPFSYTDTIHVRDTLKYTNLVRRRWLDNYFYGFTFSVNYDNHKNLQAFLGGAWNKYDGDHYGEVIKSDNAVDILSGKRYYFNNGKKKDFNIYLKVIYSLMKKVNLFADIQFRNINYDFTGYDESMNNVRQNALLGFWNPKAGISYDINSIHHLYIVYGLAHKEPNRDDYTTSTPASRPKHEILHDIEMGYHLIRSNVQFNVDGFFMKYKNQLVMTGKINQNSEYVRTNVKDSYRAGFELDGSVVFSRYMRFSAGFAYTVNKIREFTEYIDDWDTWLQQTIIHKNTDISFSPSLITFGTLGFMPFRNTTLEWNAKYIGKQYLDNTSNPDRMLNGYFVNGIRFAYLLELKLFREIELNVMVNNIFNTTYESNGWTYSYFSGNELKTDNYYFPQAGINFLAGLRVKL